MAVGLKKMKKPSPVKFPWVAAIQAGVAIWGYYSGKKKRDREARNSREALAKSRKAYTDQVYTNPYANLENPYEDLTINQKQAYFQAQQQAQARADTLEGLRATAGSAGIAGLAQAMANQSALGTQRIAAHIGVQEVRNQQLRAQGAMKVEQLERYGESVKQGKEEERIETLFGMDMQRKGAAEKAKQAAKQQLVSGLGQAAASYGTYLSANPNVSTVDSSGTGSLNYTPFQNTLGTGGGGLNPGATYQQSPFYPNQTGGFQDPFGMSQYQTPFQTNPYQAQFGTGGAYGSNFSQQQGWPQFNQGSGPQYNALTGQWE